MTKEQIKTCEELAENYKKGYMKNDDLMTFSDCRKSFVDGFKAAHQPENINNLTAEQLMGNDDVRRLVGVLKYQREEYGNDDGINKALAPFERNK